MMPNMSYGRFENTLIDLHECEESEGMNDPESLGEEEKKARIGLIVLCRSIAWEFENEGL